MHLLNADLTPIFADTKITIVATHEVHKAE